MEPVDTITTVEPKAQTMGARIGIAAAERGGFLVNFCVSSRPGLPGANVGPLAVEEGKAAELIPAAAHEQLVGPLDDGEVVLGHLEMDGVPYRAPGARIVSEERMEGPSGLAQIRE
jgi:hypothetical protein